MPLLLQEILHRAPARVLRQGEIDCAIMALPLPEAGLVMQPLYDEPFMVAVPRRIRGPAEARRSEELKKETMLLLGSGHCFRDQVLEVCPELSRFSAASDGIQRTFEGSSLETIRHMVASGIGITVLPITLGAAHADERACCAISRSTRRSRSPGGAGLAQEFSADGGHRGAGRRRARLPPEWRHHAGRAGAGELMSVL